MATATEDVTTLLLSELGRNMVIDVQESDLSNKRFKLVMLESLWADTDVVILFMRRFGCQVGRLGALKISRIQVFVEE